MRFLWSKQTASLDNISNVETPGYKSKFVTFEEALDRRLKSISSTSFKSFRTALTEVKPTLHQTDSESIRMDGNSVNLTEQMIELSRNAYQLQYAMNAISTDFSTLRTAIRG